MVPFIRSFAVSFSLPCISDSGSESFRTLDRGAPRKHTIAKVFQSFIAPNMAIKWRYMAIKTKNMALMKGG